MKLVTDQVEAFFRVASEETGSLGPTSYRAGYRLIETGNVICAVELPASVIEAVVFEHSSPAIAATTDGHVQTSMIGLAGAELNGMSSFTSEPIDSLVGRAMAVENLRMGEATIAELEMLLQRLERSVGLVKEAIVQLSHTPNS
jgi:hypothetical protein